LASAASLPSLRLATEVVEDTVGSDPHRDGAALQRAGRHVVLVVAEVVVFRVLEG
jgi:hypothetical protein